MTRLVMAVLMLLTFGSVARASDPLTDFLDGVVRYNTEYTVKPAQERVRQGRRLVRRSVVFIQRGAEATAQVATHAVEQAYHGGQTVLASFYGGGEKLNSHTANGERFNPNGLSAAHRSLPLGTHLRVSYAGRSVVVRVNDRGPAAWTGRSLDLSYGAARTLGMLGRGVAPVQIARLD